MDQADGRPGRVVGPVRRQGPHPVVLAAPGGLRRAVGQVAQPPDPLRLPRRGQDAIVDVQDHRAGPEGDLDLGAERLGQQGLGQGAGEPLGRQRQAGRRPIDRDAAGPGQPRDDLRHLHVARLADRDLDRSRRTSHWPSPRTPARGRRTPTISHRANHDRSASSSLTPPQRHPRGGSARPGSRRPALRHSPRSAGRPCAGRPGPWADRPGSRSS